MNPYEEERNIRNKIEDKLTKLHNSTKVLNIRDNKLVLEVIELFKEYIPLFYDFSFSRLLIIFYEIIIDFDLDILVYACTTIFNVLEEFCFSEDEYFEFLKQIYEKFAAKHGYDKAFQTFVYFILVYVDGLSDDLQIIMRHFGYETTILYLEKTKDWNKPLYLDVSDRYSIFRCLEEGIYNSLKDENIDLYYRSKKFFKSCGFDIKDCIYVFRYINHLKNIPYKSLYEIMQQGDINKEFCKITNNEVKKYVERTQLRLDLPIFNINDFLDDSSNEEMTDMDFIDESSTYANLTDGKLQEIEHKQINEKLVRTDAIAEFIDKIIFYSSDGTTFEMKNSPDKVDQLKQLKLIENNDFFKKNKHILSKYKKQLMKQISRKYNPQDIEK